MSKNHKTKALALFNRATEYAAMGSIMFLPTLVLLALAMTVYTNTAESAAFAKVRTVPAIIYDEAGSTGFTWVHTVDERRILMCFSTYPIPAEIDCHIATGDEYGDSGVAETTHARVKIIAPPKEV